MSTNNYATLKVEHAARCCTITFTRPKKMNALDPTMLAEVIAASHEGAESEANVIVFRGQGRAFLAGVDLDTPYFMENVNGDSIFEGTRLLDEQHEMIKTIHELPCVSIAAINGLTVGGGGFGLAMACDLRFAVADACFWLVPGQLNVIQDFGLTWFLQREIGQARTMELAFTGRRVDAATGERWGFVNQTLDDQDALDARVGEVVQTIAAMGSDSARLLKQVIRNGEHSGLTDQLRLEAIANGLCFQSEEFATAKDQMLQRLGKKSV